MPDGRVLIAFDDPALEPSPSWTRIDDTPNLVAAIEISRGRQTEFDLTDTSTAVVHLNDTDGLFDPSNTGSPYFGKIDGKQIMLQLRNPVTDTWVTQYRGFIDDYGFDLHPSQVVSNVQMECVDIFEYLSGVEMIPGLFGDTPPVGSEGVVFYEDGDVQTRITQLLTDAGLDSAMFVVFTGNVDVQETKYDPGDSILVALRDAADAEFPTISNLYTDKLGRFAFHGREAKFNPSGTASDAGDAAWPWRHWKAGDGAAVALDSTRAQIRPPLAWSRPRSRIRNAALAYPRGIAEDQIGGQIVLDVPSKDEFGYRSWPAPDLIIKEGTTTGNTADEECVVFGEFIVENYKDPKTRVEAVSFLSIHPDDPRATRVWALICGADISDLLDLKHGYPGGVGIDEDFFIEGSEMTIEPATPDYDKVSLTLNVSPFSIYDNNPFT